jgi:hypothetical protein
MKHKDDANFKTKNRVTMWKKGCDSDVLKCLCPALLLLIEKAENLEPLDA